MGGKTEKELEQRVKELEAEVRILRMELRNKSSDLEVLEEENEAYKRELDAHRAARKETVSRLVKLGDAYAHSRNRAVKGVLTIKENRAEQIEYGRTFYDAERAKGATKTAARLMAQKAIAEKFPRKMKNGKWWQGPSPRTLEKHYTR